MPGPDANERQTPDSPAEQDHHSRATLERPPNFGDTLPPEAAPLARQRQDRPTARPSPYSNVRNELPDHLKRLREVFIKAEIIEAFLAGDLACKGRGIHRKLDSCSPPLPRKLDRRLRHIAALRNKAAHDPTYTVLDHQAFLAQCEQATAELVLLIRTRRRASTATKRMGLCAVFKRISALLMPPSDQVRFQQTSTL